MNIPAPKNNNYAAVVVKLGPVFPLEGCDNIRGTLIFNSMAIVGPETEEGELGIWFPAECKLSLDFCRMNSMHRHQDLNNDPSKKGYIEDSRRVKALKMRGHVSTCLWVPISYLNYLGEPETLKLPVGTTFDHIGENEICRKYYIREPREFNGQRQQAVNLLRSCIIRHVDTENWFRNDRNVPDENMLVVSQKLHGTSVRLSKSPAPRKLGWLERLAQKLGVQVETHSWQELAGSREVVFDGDTSKATYYGENVYLEALKKVTGMIPNGYTIYGELIGWTPSGKALQKDYAYGLYPGTMDLYVYRVAVSVGPNQADLCWEAVCEFCRQRGLKTVPVLWQGLRKDFDATKFMDIRYREAGYENAVPLGEDKSLVDEGIVIRYDTRDGVKFLKAKSERFKLHESKQLDAGVIDTETAQQQAEE